MARPTAQIAAARLRPKLTRRVVERTDAYFRDLGRRVVPALTPGIRKLESRFVKAEVSTELDQAVSGVVRTFGWDGETRKLLQFITPAIDLVGSSAADAVGSELGLDASYNLFARKVVLDDVGTRVVSIADTSRDALRRLIGDEIAKGSSIEQTTKAISGLVDSWSSTGVGRILGPGRSPTSSRSYLIGLTETASAWNTSAIESYRGLGVGFVEVFDGPSCGWLSHRDPDLAHGSIRSLDEAKAHPLAHPRCQRAFGASVTARGARPSPFAGREATQIPGASPGVRAIPANISDLADALAARAAASEEAISGALSRIRGEVGAEFEGFAQRLKLPVRIAEKAAADADVLGLSPEEAVAGINDALRYTYNIADADYAEGVQATIRRLADEGINLARKADGTPRLKNFWTGDGYQGINGVFEDASGVRFELQFGTPAQAETKVISHALYEEMRVLAPGDPRILELEAQIRDLWAPIHEAAPAGVEELDSWLARFLAGDEGSLAAPRLFTSAEEAATYLDGVMPALPAAANDAELGTLSYALDRYTGGGFGTINDLLRKGEETIRTVFPEQIATDTLNAAQTNIRLLDEAMAPLPETIEVHRALYADAFGGEAFLDSGLFGKATLEVGQIYEEPAFMSTSAGADVTAYAERPIHLHLVVPVGTRAMWLRPISWAPEENELLLERGLRFRILEVRDTGLFDGQEVWAEVIPG